MQERTILTFDSDYGTLVFKDKYYPSAGIIYFRLYNFDPITSGHIFLNELVAKEIEFENKFITIEEDRIRIKRYY